MTIYSDDDDDRSLLHKAAGDRDLQALRRLLSQGANPNLPDPREVERGRTPLHHLCFCYGWESDEEDKEKEKSVICLELLLAAGADLCGNQNFTVRSC